MAATPDTTTRRRRPIRVARLETETKGGYLTTEFWLTIAVIVGILIAALVTDDPDGAQGPRGDQFQAGRAWQWIVVVTAAYAVSRGLAKSGVREPYWADRDKP